MMLAALCCGAGSALAAPVYFNFFGSPVRTDRYLRNTRDLVSSRVVRTPSLRGGQSLELTFRFSEKGRHGNLVWDVAPRPVKRIRFAVFNPNESDLEIKLYPSLTDVQRRSWMPEARILRPDEWTEFDVNLADCKVVKAKETLDAASLGDPVVFHMNFKFEVPLFFSEFGEPLVLFFDGLELF
jgi:hypothetical protein